MRYAFSLAVVLALLVAAPALAAEGHVPQSVLRIQGLVDAETVSDEEGMQVRGMSGYASARGISLVTGLVIDSATNSYVFGIDVNAAKSTAVNAGHRVRSRANHVQGSAVALSLHVETGNTPSSFFDGYLIGGAGGSGVARSK